MAPIEPDAVVTTVLADVATTVVACDSVATAVVLPASEVDETATELVVSTTVVLAFVVVNITKEADDEDSAVVLGTADVLLDALAAAQISPVMVNVSESC